MYKKMLFPKLNGFLHGGDYNPDQWLDRPDILEKDIEMMKKAHINCVTLGVFAWSAYEPREGEYHFGWLKEIMDELYSNGIYTILATPSGARPAWLDAKYPDAMRVDSYGIRNHHGGRHNHCISSENYRMLVRRIDTMLAERFANHPGMLMWHISNEFGGFCYCDTCKQKFRIYLQKKFDHNIQALNAAWWTSFWSHTYSCFEEIEPPYCNGEQSLLVLEQEWRRFTTLNTMDFIRNEIDTVRSYNNELPVTTNFMTMESFADLDYHEMSRQLDVISWDSYPGFHNDYETLEDTFLNNAFNHALFRSMKREQPFMLMESAPGVVNWRAFNKYKRPGIQKLEALQAIACGSDTVQYFQIRKGRGASEQYHGAVIDHAGTDTTRVFKEVLEIGVALERIQEAAGSVAHNEIAVVFDWNCRWAIRNAQAFADATKQYEETCRGIWRELVSMGVEPDIVKADGQWGGYKVVIAPMMYIVSEKTGKNIERFVANGGVFMGTYATGYVDENLLCHLGGFPGAGLSDVFGIISEEIDSLYPSDRNYIRWNSHAVCCIGAENDNAGCQCDSQEKQDWLISEVKDYTDLIRLKGAQALAVFEEDYVKGMPAVTRNPYKKGAAYYIGCRLQPSSMRPLFERILKEADIPLPCIPEGVEFHVRYDEMHRYAFYLNTGEKDAILSDIRGIELLTGKKLDGDIELKAKEVMIVKN